ncbi:MAG: hypothetical protein ACI9DG_002134, partial [Oleispira sp.]
MLDEKGDGRQLLLFFLTGTYKYLKQSCLHSNPIK